MKAGRVLRTRPFFVLSVLTLKVTYDLSYAFLVSSHFSWTATTYPLFPKVHKILESYVITLILSLILPHRLGKPSEFVLLFFRHSGFASYVNTVWTS